MVPKIDKCITSLTLQHRHNEVYQSFFVSHDMVISLPQTMNRWYWACWRDQPKLQVKQKLPTKMFLGISPSSMPWVHFQDITYYDLHSDSFVTQSFHDVYQWKMRQRLEETFEYRLHKSWEEGIQVSVLSEFRRGQWSWFTSSLCVLYALFLMILQENIDPEHLQKSELLKVRELSLKIDTAIYYPEDQIHEAGLLPYVALCDSDFPIAYSWWSLYYKNRFMVTNDVLQNQIIDIKDLIMWDELSHIGLEYAIIDSWWLYFSDHIKQKQWVSFAHIEKPFMKWLLEDLMAFSNSDSFSEVQEHYCQKALYQLVSYISDQWEDNLNRCLRSFRSLWILYQSAESSKDFYSRFMWTFMELRWSSRDSIALLPINSAHGKWRSLCISKTGTLSTFLPEILGYMNESSNFDCRLAYASWRDWWSIETACIEQNLTERKYSKFVSKDSIIYTNEAWEKKLASLKDILSKPTNGFLLDGISKKIYYNGVKLTSKDIVSQSTTVDLMFSLFKNIGKEIYNKELERSSYSRNKNEMLSKVILPFKKFVKNSTQKELPIDCSWGLYDYMIRLRETDIPFHMISKVGQGIMG